MSTYHSPGVYTEEVPSGPQPIAAAPTSVVAILGATRRGPVLEPTRVTGWADYLRAFGPPTTRGHVGESVFGFFENGGPAAWVIRVDPSTAASWSVLDAAGRPSFTVTAASPGAWANDLTVGVRPDADRPTGTFYRAATTGADVEVAAGDTVTLDVDGTAGLRPGDALALVPLPTAVPVQEPVEATVTALTGTSITLTASGAASMGTGSVVAGAVAAGDTSVHLPAGKGFRAGDVVTAIAPNGARTHSVATAATADGRAVTVELADANLGSVPGSAFVQRRTTYRATASVAGTPPATNIALSALAFDRPLTAPTVDELRTNDPQAAPGRITVADGRTSVWTTNRFTIPGATAPASGPVEVEAAVAAVLLADTGLSLTGLTPADVAAGYGFLPAGAQLTYTGVKSDGTAADPVTATRTASGFTLAPAPAGEDTYTAATFTVQGTADAGIAVRCALAPRVGDRLQLGTAFAAITDVVPAGGETHVLRFASGTATDPAQTRFGLFAVADAAVVADRWSLQIGRSGVIAETHAGLSLSPGHPRYFAQDDVVNRVSALVTVAARGPGAPPVSADSAPYSVSADLIGSDRTPANDDFRAGLLRLEEVEEPAMLICPDALLLGDPLLQADLIGQVVTHCEGFRRFAVLDAPDLDDVDLLTWRNTTVASTYAAVFAPHLRIVTLDPDSTDRFATVPASGFVAGVMARTDRLRGVHKAPGNESVSGVVGLSRTYTTRRQDLLNPAGVNLIRAFPGRGTRIWGARNATDDAIWRYINVRRLFNMIETSVDRATQWVVFEPNTAQTWIRVKVSVENFLEGQWRAGALAGATPDQAYRVRVGLGETMTETDIDLGYIITEVAIAPAKPAEFVVFRFSHKRLDD
ncbi:phage tail sheath subtilisin-like domain-containing protein [Arthrobacter sp. JSM 101049]|uniref:phage tail sheath subtilisin-like domain-containing protein n=1 Tax=Arthrobacter sp. JSM 101049 TaxID=929097 RepID=UPI00356A26BF